MKHLTIRMPHFQKRRSLAGKSLLVVLLVPLALVVARADWVLPEAKMIGKVTIAGDLGKDESVNLSGIDGKGELLLAGSDEGDEVRLLRREGERSFKTSDSDLINLKAGGEVDVEGVAWGKDYVYVIGSHSRKRKKVDADKMAAENFKRLETTGIEPTRDNLYRLELGEGGEIKSTKQVTLRDVFANDLLLRPFQVIPSKENGIDIEGLAVHPKKERLYIGFRGPVLRGNYVPVMVLKADENFKQKSLSHEVRFVMLEGRGIRGLETVSDGFLVLAGPVGDGPASYRLYFWNGESCVGGTDLPLASKNIKALCEIPTPEGAKAEAIHLVEESDDQYRFIIAYDSLPQGGMTEFTTPR